MIDTVSNLVELVRIDDHKSGCHNTHGQHDVSMIMEENSSDQSFNTYYKVAESKMFQPPVKTHKPLQYVSICIKQ